MPASQRTPAPRKRVHFHAPPLASFLVDIRQDVAAMRCRRRAAAARIATASWRKVVVLDDTRPDLAAVLHR